VTAAYLRHAGDGGGCGRAHHPSRSVAPMVGQPATCLTAGGFPVDAIGFDVGDCFRPAGALGVESLTVWGLEVFLPVLDAMTAEEIGQISRATLDRLLSA
jgi:hypothetical protein